MSKGAGRPSLADVWRNFREYDAPVGVKSRMFIANNFRKLRRRSGCCGNGGEPGC